MRIIADLHTHTKFSIGQGSLLDNVTSAMAKGLKAVAITDFRPQGTTASSDALREFRQRRREVSAFDRRSEGLLVLAGADCSIVSRQGRLDLSESVLSQLDILLAGMRPALLPNSWLTRVSSGWERKALVYNTEALVAAIYSSGLDVITHPGYHLPVDMAEVARACVQQETALEISAHYPEIDLTRCREAAGEGVRFVVTSGARTPDAVGDFGQALEHVRAIGLPPAQVLNSEEGNLFAWLERRRSMRTDRSGWSDWAGHPEEGPEPDDEEPDRPPRHASQWTDWSQQGKIH